MNNKDRLARIIGELDDRIISESAHARIFSGEAETAPEKKGRGVLRWIETAACLLLVTGMIGAVIILPSLTKKSGPGTVTESPYSYPDVAPVMNIVEWLDGLGFDPEMSEEDFNDILKSYRYNGKSVYEELNFMAFDTTSGGGTEGHSKWFSSFYGFEVHDKADEWYVRFEASDNAEGFTLPRDVRIGDSLSTVCSAFMLREVSLNELEQTDYNNIELYKEDYYSVNLFPTREKEGEPISGCVLKCSYSQRFGENSEMDISVSREVSFRFEKHGDQFTLSEVAINNAKCINHPVETDSMIPVSYRGVPFFDKYWIESDHYWNEATIIRSTEELDSHIAACIGEVADKEGYSPEDIEEWRAEAEEIRSCYNDAYFENHDLILLPLSAGSGSITFMLSSIVRQEDGLMVTVNTYTPEVCTDDMQYLCWAIETETKLMADDIMADGVTFCEVNDRPNAFTCFRGTYDDDYDGLKPVGTLIRSREELEKYLERYLKSEKEYNAMKETADRYTEDYFKTNYLVMVSVNVGSGSYRLNIPSLYNNWSGIEVMLETVTEKGMDETTDDVGSWIVVIEGEGILPEEVSVTVNGSFREVEQEEFKQYADSAVILFEKH